MFQLTLTATLLTSATGTFARVVDTSTSWSQLSGGRTAWALFLAGTQLGSITAQNRELDPLSYEPHTFQSGANPAGTVDVLLPTGSGVFRLQAAAVRVLADDAALAAAAAGRLYYRLDTGQFVAKLAGGLARVVSTWSELVASDPTTLATDGLTADAYIYNDASLQAALARLNLRYLQVGTRGRATLLAHYLDAQLLLSGAQHQFNQAYYADAATTLTAAGRLLGSCADGLDQSPPARASTSY